MDSVQSFINEEKKYLLLIDIKKSNVNKAYFIGCKTMRKVILKHDIPDEVCLYMKSGIIYNKSYNPANLYIEEKYAEQHIMNKSVLLNKKKQITETKTETRNKKLQERKAYNEYELTYEPPLIELEEHEMYKDLNGSPMDILVRGEKTDEGIYFKAKDIGTAFYYELVEQTIIDRKSDHVYGKHFKYFIGPDTVSSQIDDKKVLYLTYLGVVKLLFCARGDKAKRFQIWATNILFTMQIGKESQQMQEMQLKHQIEKKEYENKLQDHELMLLKKDRALEKKDYEIERLQWKHKTELQENELKYLRQLLK